MTRKQAISYYLELRNSGRLEDFATKNPDTMTQREKELFYYEDGQVFFNHSVGKLDYYYHPLHPGPRIDENLFFEIIDGEGEGRLFSDLSEQDLRGLGIYD